VPGNAEGMAQLRAALRAEPPSGLGVLDDATLMSLAASVREAQDQQARELNEAGDRALRLIPALLRKPVRKAMFG
jgi:hypothetical protein